MQIEASDRTPPILWLHLGLGLTGVGTTLLGCLLPSLISAWHLTDDRAGLLFAAQFSGASLGALLVNSSFIGSLMRGHFLLVASAVGVALSSGAVQIVLFFSFGLGLGLTMTATSLLVSSMFTTRRGAALSLLNASWAIGAVVCPAIAYFWTLHYPAIYSFLALAAAFGVVLVAVGKDYSAFAAMQRPPREIGKSGKLLVLLLVSTVIAFLYVGVEVSVSGWMMTYVHRMPASNQFWPPIATSSFWIALVCGRALVPTVLRWVPEAPLFRVSLMIAFISVLLLLVSHSLAAIALCAVFAGLVLGPIFPLCMARILDLTDDSPKTKWIFAVPGLGGALLAWMTGRVSTYGGSLRAGLMVPVLALVAMILLHQFSTSNSRTS